MYSMYKQCVFKKIYPAVKDFRKTMDYNGAARSG